MYKTSCVGSTRVKITAVFHIPESKITVTMKICYCVFVCVFMFISHVIEECCERTENSSGHTCKEEQLPVEEASYKSSEPPPPLCLLLWSGLCCAQGQSDGQSICNGVDLHMDWQTVEYGCPRQTPGWRGNINNSYIILNLIFEAPHRKHPQPYLPYRVTSPAPGRTGWTQRSLGWRLPWAAGWGATGSKHDVQPGHTSPQKYNLIYTVHFQELLLFYRTKWTRKREKGWIKTVYTSGPRPLRRRIL